MEPPDRPHDNEELLGEALRPFRDRVVIATKFGLTFDSPEAAGPPCHHNGLASNCNPPLG